MRSVRWNGRYTGYGLEHVRARESVQQLILTPSYRERHGLDDSDHDDEHYSTATTTTTTTLEEELIVQEHTVSWFNQSGIKYLSTSCRSAVVSVCWAPFARLRPTQPCAAGADHTNTIDSVYEMWLCILHQEGLKLVPLAGQELDVALPCRMAAMHAIPFGVVLERARDAEDLVATASASSEPRSFVLRHPLEQVVPLALHPTSTSTSTADQLPPPYIDDPNLSICFSSIHEPIIVTYHWSTKVHTVWRVHHVARATLVASTVTATAAAAVATPPPTAAFGAFDMQAPSDEVLPEPPAITPHTHIERLLDLPQHSTELAANIFLAGSGIEYSRPGSRQLLLCVLFDSLYELHTYVVDRKQWRLLASSVVSHVRAAVPIMAMRHASRHAAQLALDCSTLDIVLLHQPARAKRATMRLHAGERLLCELALPPSLRNCTIDSLANPVNGIWSIVTDRGDHHRVYISHEQLPLSQLVCDCISAASLVLDDTQLLALLRATLSDRATGSSGAAEPLLHLAEWNNLCEHLLSSFLIEAGTTGHRASDSMADGDAWQFLLASPMHFELSAQLQHMELEEPRLASLSVRRRSSAKPEALALHRLLHLVYESRKLNSAQWNDLAKLAPLLAEFASALRSTEHLDMYVRDAFAPIAAAPPTEDDANVIAPLADEAPFDVYHACLARSPTFPPQVLEWLQHPCFSSLRRLLALYAHVRQQEPNPFVSVATKPSDATPSSLVQSLVLLMVREHVDLPFIRQLPFGLALPLLEVIRECRSQPPGHWPREAYMLLEREDLAARPAVGLDSGASSIAATTSTTASSTSITGAPTTSSVTAPGDHESDAIATELPYVSGVSRMVFGKDLRLLEVQQLLQATQCVTISEDEAGINEHELLALHQTKLRIECNRVLATALGRAMFTIGTRALPMMAPVPVPSLNVDGTLPGSSVVIALDRTQLPQNFFQWAEFHNGVAAGLSVSPHSADLDKLELHSTPTDSKAGVLLGFGLRKLLRNLDSINLYKLLNHHHELTTVALLLGLATGHVGDMDIRTAKILSIHIPALHPPASTDLELLPTVKTAALFGMGLLYAESSNRQMAEMLLEEIAVRPSDDGAFFRESYSLAAGLALGFVTLGSGNSNTHGLADLAIEDRLMWYIEGTNSRATSTRPLRPPPKSGLVLEPDGTNISITAPGATLALTLMYLKTNNAVVAGRLELPSTAFLLEAIRPDQQLLRALCRALIMWDSIEPTAEWLAAQVPNGITERLGQLRKPASVQSGGAQAKVNLLDFASLEEFIMVIERGSAGDAALADKEERDTLETARTSIIAGACLALGIRYAGTCHAPAFSVLMSQLQQAKKAFEVPRLNLPALFHAELCLNVVALAASLLMAGSGNLELLRLLRAIDLQRRALAAATTAANRMHSSYGGHMAQAMSLGLLFLGGGTYSIRRSNVGIAGLLCALFPLFPYRPDDTRYHLQCFRHMWVLAVEQRCLVARDVDTAQLCFLPITLTLKETDTHAETELDLVAPCVLPELDSVCRIATKTPRYWHRTIDIERHQGDLHSVLECFYVKRKTGYVSYVDDPNNTRGLLARSFPRNKAISPTETKELLALLKSFTSEPIVEAFSKLFCQNPADTLATAAMLSPAVRSDSAALARPGSLEHESSLVAFCSLLLYDCIVREKLHVLPVYLQLTVGLTAAPPPWPSSHFTRSCWAVLRFYASARTLGLLHASDLHLAPLSASASTLLLQPEFLSSLESRLKSAYNIATPQLAAYLATGALPATERERQQLLSTLLLYGIPSFTRLSRSIHDVLDATPASSASSNLVPELLLPALARAMPSLPVAVLLHVLRVSLAPQPKLSS